MIRRRIVSLTGQRFDNRDATEIAAALATIAAGAVVKNAPSVASIPSLSKISGSGTNSSRQLVQMRRTRRCAQAMMTELEIRNGSMPMSSRRVIAPAASFVCNVLRAPGDR